MENDLKQKILGSLHAIKSMCQHNLTWEYHETVSDFELIKRQVEFIEKAIAESELDKKEECKKFMRSGIVGGFLIDNLD